jgi:mono/diheme cytochrome c family protein
VLPLVLSACFDNNDEPSFEVADLPKIADAEHGKKIFDAGVKNAPACASCHTIDGKDTAAAPSLKGLAKRAEDAEKDESAQEYLLHSIIAPGKQLAGGYGNQMYGNYADKLSKQEIADLIAYLQTLE